MKTERRQELKTNDLAIYLQQLGDYFQTHSNKLLIGLIVLVCIAGGFFYSIQSRKQALQAAWGNYYELVSKITPDPKNPRWADDAIGKLEGFLSLNDQPIVNRQVRWDLAELCLNQAIQEENSAGKIKWLDQAENHLRPLTQQREDRVLRAAALNGLAAVEESRFVVDGDLSRKEKAQTHLEVIRNDPEFLGTPFQADVLARLNEYERLWQPMTLTDPSPPASQPTTSNPTAPEPSSSEQPSAPADSEPTEESAESKDDGE